MRLFARQAKTLTLGTALALGSVGFAGPVAAGDYTFREPKVPNQDVEEQLPTAQPTGKVGEVGTARSNQPHGDEVQEQKLLTGEPKGQVGELGTERENLPTEDES